MVRRGWWGWDLGPLIPGREGVWQGAWWEEVTEVWWGEGVELSLLVLSFVVFETSRQFSLPCL